MTGAGAVGAAALVTGCGSAPGPNPTPPAPPAVTDADILTFALNLEYLEAEFYLRALTGSGLTSADGSGTVTGGAKVPFVSPVIAAYAAEISENELTHVRFLRSALTAASVTPITAPAIDFTNAFASLATAAKITLPAAFNPFADENSFLLGAFIFEDVGVTAYTGAAALIQNKAYLNAAAGIQAVEAYHAAEIRTIISNRASIVIAPATTTAPAVTMLSAANAISTLRGSVGGGGETAISPGSLTAAATISAADGSGLAYGRSTDQVLHIVYATPIGAGVLQRRLLPQRPQRQHQDDDHLRTN